MVPGVCTRLSSSLTLAREGGHDSSEGIVASGRNSGFCCIARGRVPHHSFLKQGKDSGILRTGEKLWQDRRRELIQSKDAHASS